MINCRGYIHRQWDLLSCRFKHAIKYPIVKFYNEIIFTTPFASPATCSLAAVKWLIHLFRGLDFSACGLFQLPHNFSPFIVVASCNAQFQSSKDWLKSNNVTTNNDGEQNEFFGILNTKVADKNNKDDIVVNASIKIIYCDELHFMEPINRIKTQSCIIQSEKMQFRACFLVECVLSLLIFIWKCILSSVAFPCLALSTPQYKYKREKTFFVVVVFDSRIFYVPLLLLNLPFYIIYCTIRDLVRIVVCWINASETKNWTTLFFTLSVINKYWKLKSHPIEIAFFRELFSAICIQSIWISIRKNDRTINILQMQRVMFFRNLFVVFVSHPKKEREEITHLIPPKYHAVTLINSKIN